MIWQAYTVELEAELNNLKEENSILLEEQVLLLLMTMIIK